MRSLYMIPTVLAMTILAACASSGVKVSSATGSSGTSDGRFVWQDLVTTDATAARRFYGALLGWQFADGSRAGRPYAIARTAGGPVGGLVDVKEIKDAGSQWVSYVAVANLDTTVQQLQKAGGRVIVPPTPTGAGRAAVVVDPQGAALGLLQPSITVPADPPQPVAAHFFWREYLAQDSTRALAFYKDVLGYDAAAADARIGLDYFVLRRDAPRAGLFQIPATANNVRPNWLPYILVADPAAMAAKVSGLGGRVLLEPSPDRRNGTLAIVADPTGGVVALQKFPI